MKDKIIGILKGELFPVQLVDDSDPIEIVGFDRAADKIEQLYTKQPAVSEDKLSEIFANHADNTPYLNFTAFKEAVKELLNR